MNINNEYFWHGVYIFISILVKIISEDIISEDVVKEELQVELDVMLESVDKIKRKLTVW